MKDLIAKLKSDACCAMGAIWIHIDAREAQIAELEAENTNLRYELNAALSDGTVSCLSADTDKLREAILALPMQVPRVAGGSVALLSPWEQTCFNNGAIAMRKAAAELVASTALQAPVREVPETWISVDDRMPEQLKDVLIWEKYSTSPCIAYHNGRKWSASQEHYDTYSSYGPGASLVDKLSQDLITHWMPLPAAPVQEPKP